MMRQTTEQLERRMVYHLDGELDENERVGLYRELLKNPDARDTMDRYAAVDRRANEALRSLLGEPAPAPKIKPAARPAYRRLPWRQIGAAAAVLLVAVTGWTVSRLSPNDESPRQPAIARAPAPEPQPTDAAASSPAAATATAEATTSSQPPVRRIPDAESARSTRIPEVASALPEPSRDPWWRSRPSPMEDEQLVDRGATAPLIPGPQHARRTSDKSYLGVVADDGQTVYWLEVDRDQTVVQSAAGEL